MQHPVDVFFCFVTIRIFARTEPNKYAKRKRTCFVTIRIFARTEHERYIAETHYCFVTIRIFARTEQLSLLSYVPDRFVTIRIFAGTDLKNEKGSDTPARKGRGAFPSTFYCVNVN